MGKLIVIEGTDGSGKGTQTKALIDKFKKGNKKVIMFDYPNYSGFFGNMVGKYLNNEFGKATKISPYLASLMYAGDRWQAKEEIKKALKEDNIVVINRYVPSNMAHQAAKLPRKEWNDFFSWIKKLEYEIYDIPKPNKIIFLYVPTNISQKLVDRKKKRDYTQLKRDGHEADKNYLSNTSLVFHELAKQEKWDIIECVEEGKLLSIEKIHDKIWEKVKDI